MRHMSTSPGTHSMITGVSGKAYSTCRFLRVSDDFASIPPAVSGPPIAGRGPRGEGRRNVGGWGAEVRDTKKSARGGRGPGVVRVIKPYPCSTGRGHLRTGFLIAQRGACASYVQRIMVIVLHNLSFRARTNPALSKRFRENVVNTACTPEKDTQRTPNSTESNTTESSDTCTMPVNCRGARHYTPGNNAPVVPTTRSRPHLRKKKHAQNSPEKRGGKQKNARATARHGTARPHLAMKTR